MDNAGVITHIVTQFNNMFYSGLSTIQGYVISVTMGLIVIDGVFFFIGTFWGGGLMAGWFNRLIRYAIFLGIASEYPSMIEQVITGFFEVGAAMAGGGISQQYITDPGSLIDKGWGLCEETYNKLVGTESGSTGGSSGVIDTIKGAMDALSVQAVVVAFMTFLVILAIMVCFTIMAVQIALTIIEFYTVGLIMYVLIPFGVLRPMAFMAEKAFGSILTFGVKICALAIVGSMIDFMFSSIPSPAFMDITEAMYLFITALFMAFLTWVVPGMAASACGGSPSLGASGAVSTAVGAAGATIAGAKMGYGIAKGGSNAARNSYNSIRDRIRSRDGESKDKDA